ADRHAAADHPARALDDACGGGRLSGRKRADTRKAGCRAENRRPEPPPGISGGTGLGPCHEHGIGWRFSADALSLAQWPGCDPATCHRNSVLRGQQRLRITRAVAIRCPGDGASTAGGRLVATGIARQLRRAVLASSLAIRFAAGHRRCFACRIIGMAAVDEPEHGPGCFPVMPPALPAAQTRLCLISTILPSRLRGADHQELSPCPSPIPCPRSNS